MTLLNTLSKKNELIERLESENACLKLKLSARDKEWKEKIEKFLVVPEWDYSEREIRINIDDWNNLLSQMKEGE